MSTPATPSPQAAEPARPGRTLALILLAGAAVRIGLICWFHGQPVYVHDARSYDSIAVNLAERGEFAQTAGNLTSIRPPLYPFLLAGIYRVAGVQNHDAVRVVQAILSLLSVVLLYRLARELFDTRTALWAAALCCFYPSLLWLQNVLLTETLFIVWTLLACLLLRRCLTAPQGGDAVASDQGSSAPNAAARAMKPGDPAESKRPHGRSLLLPLVALGVVLGLGALTRSILWLFFPFLYVFLVLALPTRSIWQRLLLAAVPVLAFALTILPWSVRNTRLQQTFTTIDVMGGRNFMMGNYEFTPLYRAWDAISIRGPESWIAVLLRDKPADVKLTQGRIDKRALRRTVGYVREHPGLTVQRSLVKFCNFWQLERSLFSGAMRGWWGINSRALALALGLLAMASYALCMTLAIFGFVMLPAADWRMHWFLLLLVAFTCAVHTVTFGHSRYHLPLIPLVLIYTAAALTHARDIWARRRSMAFLVASVIVLALGASWVWEIVVVELPRG